MDLLEAIRSITISASSFQFYSELLRQPTSELISATHVYLTIPTLPAPPPPPTPTPTPTPSHLKLPPPPSSSSSSFLTSSSSSSLGQENQTPSSSSSSSSHPQLFEITTLLPLYSTKGQLNIASVIYAWETKELPFASYLTGATAVHITPTAVFERHDLLDWLKGSKPQCTHLLSQTSSDYPKPELLRIPGRSDDSENIKRIKAREYLLRTRTSYLTPPGNKTFSHLAKLCHDLFLHPKFTQPQEAPLKKAVKRPVSGTEPILLVPPGFSPLLNMMNVKAFLESAVFESTEELKAKGVKKPTKLELQRKAPVGSHLKKTWKIAVLDSIDSLEPDDWDRVVAVFAGGMAWQFHDWKWSQPVDLFSHIRGYHLKYMDEVTKPPVDQWNVKVLSLHRTKRHLDQSLVLEFWTDLEKWVAVNKPHLLN